MSSSSRSTSSSITQFRSRRSPAVAAAAAPPPARTSSGGRGSAPSSSARPTASFSSSGGRPTTPSAAFARLVTPNSAQPTTPSCTASSRPSSFVNENMMVTVRFRPLSPREINKGDEVAWYAYGDNMVCNEYNPNIAYVFDKVFGPATTTCGVYDIAAQHVVSGAMEGINGTVFAYGVTSSGKTHTMHGEEKSPGIIPLAVKDVFNIIQDTPGRKFLLRASYLEIYNEVINDLLDPKGQNLRIREDAQGTYVVGLKEEVVLSPARALSLIASGEERRHVGSNNFNLVSSQSHTIFTLTIESSPASETEEEEVRLCQLKLIDLAWSESSKTELTELHRKEGSYIKKSLLALGTVIAKLTDGKAAHIPYRDSKLTRLLQYSLSGHGRISLICTVTPASRNTRETHNTIKFAHRSKHLELKNSQNKIIYDKSLIKKNQNEITCLEEDLILPDHEDLVNLELQREVTAASPVNMASLPPPANINNYEDLWIQQTHARILVSDAEAGYIIGKNGSTIVHIMSTTGALVKISHHRQLLPGTKCRVLLLSGLLYQVLDATDLVLRKIIYQDDQMIDAQAAVVLVVPRVCCSTLIGKGGEVIKLIAQSSNTRIEISPYNECYGMRDRLVTIIGSLDYHIRALFSMLSELLKDEYYSRCSSGPVFLGCDENDVPNEHLERYHIRPKKPTRSLNNDAQESRTIAIADEHIGAVIGHAGRKLRDICQATHARIKTSAKGEFLAGTSDRLVVISGTREEIDAAEGMIRRVILALKLDTTPGQPEE